MHKNKYAYMQICIPDIICICACMIAYSHSICLYAELHICPYAHMAICICACVYVCLCMSRLIYADMPMCMYVPRFIDALMAICIWAHVPFLVL